MSHNNADESTGRTHRFGGVVLQHLPPDAEWVVPVHGYAWFLAGRGPNIYYRYTHDDDTLLRWSKLRQPFPLNDKWQWHPSLYSCITSAANAEGAGYCARLEKRGSEVVMIDPLQGIEDAVNLGFVDDIQLAALKQAEEEEEDGGDLPATIDSLQHGASLLDKYSKKLI